MMRWFIDNPWTTVRVGAWVEVRPGHHDYVGADVTAYPDRLHVSDASTAVGRSTLRL